MLALIRVAGEVESILAERGRVHVGQSEGTERQAFTPSENLKSSMYITCTPFGMWEKTGVCKLHEGESHTDICL